MKLFLKSIAFFLSFALLFTACSQDETTDPEIELPVLPSPTVSEIDGVKIGNGRIQLTWEVPSDENILGCVISWSGDGSGTKEVLLADVEYQLGEDDRFITDTLTLSKGTYTISIENFGDDDVEFETSPATIENVKVYDDSSYSTHPTESQVTYMRSDNSSGVDEYNVVDIMWGDVPGDFVGLVITYELDEEIVTWAKTARLEDIEAESFTRLVDVKQDTYYTFTSYFLPEGAWEGEYVILTDTEKRLVPECAEAAAAPSNLTMQPGNGRLMISWTTTDDVTASNIQLYKEDASGDISYDIITVEADDLVVGGENAIYISEIAGSGVTYSTTNSGEAGSLEIGNYYVKMTNNYNEATSVKSEVTALVEKVSDMVTSDGSITVYNEAGYDTSGAPTIRDANYSWYNNAAGDNTLIEWNIDNIGDDLISVSVTYGGVTQPDTSRDDLLYGTFIDEVYNSKPYFTFSAKFQPTGALDVIEVKIDTDTFARTSNGYTVSAKTPDIRYSSSVYYINSARGFKAYADLIDAYANTSAALTYNFDSAASFSSDDGYPGISAQLVNNIDMTELTRGDATISNWRVIDNTYTGTFNGAGYSINNLYIKSSMSYTAIFGYTGAATIKNLTLGSPKVEIWDYCLSGVVAGRATTDTVITDCTVTNSKGNGDGYLKVVSDYGSGITNLGVFIGLSNGAIVSGCTNDIPVTHGGSGNNYVGGIIGSTATNATTIVDCVNNGAIYGSGNYAGGIVGYVANYNYIFGCVNTGKVSSGSYIGGIVGNLGVIAYIAACYNTGDVVSHSGGQYIGGIVGRAQTSGSYMYGCYSTGAVYSSLSSSTAPYIGAIAGSADNIIFNSNYFIYKEYGDKTVETPVKWAIGTTTAYTDKVGVSAVGTNTDGQACEVDNEVELNSWVDSDEDGGMNAAIKTLYTSTLLSGVSSSYMYELQKGSGNYDLPEVVSY